MESKRILDAWFLENSSQSEKFEAFRSGAENQLYSYIKDDVPFFLLLRIDGLEDLIVVSFDDLKSTALFLNDDDFEGDLSFPGIVVDTFGYEEEDITIGAGDNLLSSRLEKTVWVGDENYQPCDCGFSGVVGFKGGIIYELGEFGSKEPTGCFPYNFLFRDYNGKIENYKDEVNKIVSKMGISVIELMIKYESWKSKLCK
jgi:hypothetical protein